MPIKVIGFDLDQTLYPKSPEIDSAIQTYLYEKIRELHKVSIEEAKIMFNGLYQADKGLSGSRTLAALGFPLEQARELVQEALENADIDKFLKPDQDTIELLSKIKNKYQNVDLVTGSKKTIALKKLSALDISESLFLHIITADDGSKSDLSMYKKWLGLYPELSPKNFLYIGDRVSSDYEKPKELGIQSILVNIKVPDPAINCVQLPNLNSIRNYLIKK